MKTNPESLGVAAAKLARFRVLVVDDHPLVREGLAELINQQSDVMCCGLAGDVPAARMAVGAQQPDLVVVDLRLGQADGLELITELRAGFAAVRLLALSQLDELVYAERALRAGADGFVMKEQATEELLTAMRQVLAGNLYVSPRVATMAVRRMIEEKPRTRGADIGATATTG